MKRLVFILSLTLGAVIATSAVAAAITPISVRPSTYVGAAGDCGTDYPPGTPGGVTAAWVQHQGLHDYLHQDWALILNKKVLTTDCSAAQAVVRGVKGRPANSLGFDYRGDSYCGAGAPRFNVETTDNGFAFVGGCANGTPTSLGFDRRGAQWWRVTFDLSSVVELGPILKSVGIIEDEQGRAILDNIMVNGHRVGRPAH